MACEADASPTRRLKNLPSPDGMVSVHNRDGYSAINVRRNGGELLDGMVNSRQLT